jgi:hypothetical protein
MAKLIKSGFQALKGVASVVFSFAAVEKQVNHEQELNLKASMMSPDFVLFFTDEDCIPKVVTSLQKNGFLITELEPNKIFALQCKYEMLLQSCERFGWKRTTKS